MDSLLGVDWEQAWCEKDNQRKLASDKTSWNERSKDYAKHAGHSDYASTFLRYLDLTPNQSVFDMGCGPGTLALPLAKAGHRVIAADFSSGMLEAADERVKEAGVSNLELVSLDWNDDWEAQGIQAKSVDVAIASRSTITSNLAESLMKLDAIAREKVAITMITEFSPKGYEARGSTQGGTTPYLSDYIYGMNILFQRGAYPELRYIDSIRGNGGEREGQLVRWAFITWKPLT